MSTYRKEKNLIIISLDNASGDYRLDLNTGVLYGVKGSPIKTCPRKREVVDLFPRWGDGCTNLTSVIGVMIDRCSNTLSYPAFVTRLLAADKIDAVGVGVLDLWNDQYEYVGNHIKELVAYMKLNERFCYSSFRAWAEFENAKKKLGSLANSLTDEMYYAIINNLTNPTVEEIGVCAYYLGRGKYWEYHRGNLSNLTRYIEMCRLMEKEPQKVNNFMREYCETLNAYKLRKQEFDDRKLNLNYAKHSKAWEFEYGDFIIAIPTCGQDIVTEGQLMHHCVGSYVDNVVENSTYICFVRRKDNPDVPYITCQVYTNGNIGQYFLAYDRYISSDEDKAFKSAFANHLREVWGD